MSTVNPAAELMLYAAPEPGGGNVPPGYEQAGRPQLLGPEAIIRQTHPFARDLASLMIDATRPELAPTEAETHALAAYLYQGCREAVGASLVTRSVASPRAEGGVRDFIADTYGRLAGTPLLAWLLEGVRTYGGYGDASGSMIDAHLESQHKERLQEGSDKINTETFGRRLGVHEFPPTSGPTGKPLFTEEALEAYHQAMTEASHQEGERLKAEKAALEARRERKEPGVDEREKLLTDVFIDCSARLLAAMRDPAESSQWREAWDSGRFEQAETAPGDTSKGDIPFDAVHDLGEDIRDILRDKLSDLRGGRIRPEDVADAVRLGRRTVAILRALFTNGRGSTADEATDSGPETAGPRAETPDDDAFSGAYHNDAGGQGGAEQEAGAPEWLTATLNRLYEQVDPERQRPWRPHPLAIGAVSLTLAKAIDYLRIEKNFEESLLVAEMSVEAVLAAIEYRQLRQRLSRKATVAAMLLRRAVDAFGEDSTTADESTMAAAA